MIAVKKSRNRLIILILLLCTASCRSDIIFTDSVILPDKKWTIDNVITFEVPVTDTLNSAEITFPVRTGSEYPYRNLYLFISARSPKGVVIADTIEYQLTNGKGEWYGKGAGDIHELELPFRKNIYFPETGNYTFRIQHGMRSLELNSVYDLGIRITKVKQ
jgi:gliding motility-associated lipoprotein GldH